MAGIVGDLKLDDEHSTIGLDDTLQEGAKRLLTVQNGILVVLDDDNQVKGVLGTKQFLKAFSEGKDASKEQCKEYMEMDFLLVKNLLFRLKFLTSETEIPQQLVRPSHNHQIQF